MFVDANENIPTLMESDSCEMVDIVCVPLESRFRLKVSRGMTNKSFGRGRDMFFSQFSPSPSPLSGRVDVELLQLQTRISLWRA